MEKKGSSMRSQAAHTARAANRRFEKELLSFLLYAKLLVSYAFCVPYLLGLFLIKKKASSFVWYLFVIFSFVWYLFYVKTTNNNQEKIRATHNLFEAFFSFFEKSIRYKKHRISLCLLYLLKVRRIF